jgi:hypothetical protein
MKTKRLMICQSLSEAHIIKGRLNSEGIECFLANENSNSILPVFNSMCGLGIQVIVRDIDYEKAFKLLQESGTNK